jgi:two-component system, LuxR family, sensor kinase FixL
MMPRSLLAPALLSSVGYYLGARLGFALTLYPEPVSTLWPPNAILLAALLLTPTRHWSVVVSAAFPAHLVVQLNAGVPMLMILCWFVSNSSEALLGAWLVRALVPGRLGLDSFAQVAAFGCAAFVSPFVTSFLDAAFVSFNNWGQAGYWDVWRTRFFSNVLAMLTLAPAIVTAGGAVAAWRRTVLRRRAEAVLLGIALVTVCYAVFVVQDAPGSTPALLYVPLPLLLWAAVRFGPAGLSVASLIVAILALWGAAGGQGPFVTSSPADNALSMQLFLIVTTIPLMALAAVMEERRGAAVVMRQNEERLNLALSAVQLGTWELDIRRGQMEWSVEARKILGVPLGEPPETFEAFLRLVHPDDQPAVTSTVSQAIATCGSFEIEFRLLRPDGTLRWLFSKGKPLCDEAGVPHRVTGVQVDTTDRKQAELEAQRHRREVAHLGRVALLGELSGALAHELNQPLAAILTNARAGQRFLAHDPPDLEQLHEILTAIVDDDRRAGNVITRLRALLKNDDVRHEPLDLNAVVQEVERIIRADLIARDVSLTIDLSPDSALVTGDRVQLQQVVLNLVLNACDAMQATLPGRRRLLVATAVDERQGVRVAVSDNGTGIRAENLEQIFDPFVTSKAQGLGLGLAICRSIASAHDGRLWAENNSDGGATFYLVLPYSSEGATVVEVLKPA